MDDILTFAQMVERLGRSTKLVEQSQTADDLIWGMMVNRLTRILQWVQTLTEQSDTEAAIRVLENYSRLGSYEHLSNLYHAEKRGDLVSILPGEVVSVEKFSTWLKQSIQDAQRRDSSDYSKGILDAYMMAKDHLDMMVDNSYVERMTFDKAMNILQREAACAHMCQHGCTRESCDGCVSAKAEPAEMYGALQFAINLMKSVQSNTSVRQP